MLTHPWLEASQPGWHSLCVIAGGNSKCTREGKGVRNKNKFAPSSASKSGGRQLRPLPLAPVARLLPTHSPTPPPKKKPGSAQPQAPTHHTDALQAWAQSPAQCSFPSHSPNPHPQSQRSSTQPQTHTHHADVLEAGPNLPQDLVGHQVAAAAKGRQRDFVLLPLRHVQRPYVRLGEAG